ncbi:MAG TPA: prepilin-type N-terminal cleavage/methylation domain-containing protein [Planctomycetota bacterium]|nr:prepilin-type N-terminal cleavage/methylation domain-containing protein [Planctomycetota bacterium]
MADFFSRSRRPRAFTLIELMMVMVVLVLLVIIGAPSLSRLTKSTKVEQAAHAVMGALWEARSLAQRNRVTTAVLFGVDRTIAPAPLETADYYLPEKNQIEIWQVKANGWRPYAPEYPAGAPDWYPYRFPMRNLTRVPISVPDGVRVIACRAGSYWNSSTDNGWFVYGGDGWDAFKKNPMGVWKRHVCAYNRSGTITPESGDYRTVLVYEESSGDHLMITIGNSYNGTQRPRIDRNRINKVAGKKLTDPRLLHQEIMAWGGDR